MDYQKIYNQIIDRAKSRTLICYKEKHHIIPKCMNGSDDKTNLAELTAKEHFICHELLIEIYPANSKLKGALWCMITAVSTSQQRYKPSARIYERIKLEYIKLPVSQEARDKLSLKLKGRVFTEEWKQKLKDGKKRQYDNGYISHSKGKKLDFKQIWVDKGLTEQEAQDKWDEKTENQRKLMLENNPFKGKHHTEEVKQESAKRTKELLTGTHQSEEHKKRRAESYKNTYYNSQRSQDKRKQLNKENRLKQLVTLRKDLIVSGPNNIYFKCKMLWTELSKYILKNYNEKILPQSLMDTSRGMTKSTKTGWSVKILQ